MKAIFKGFSELGFRNSASPMFLIRDAVIFPPVADILIYTWKRKGKSMRSGTTAGRAARGPGLQEGGWRKTAAILRCSESLFP